MTKREALITKIKQQTGQKDYTELGPVVSLEDFFEGNEDLGSIGCNLIEHPGIERFYQTLKEIRDKVEVQDTVVEIYEFDEADETVWPFSERIYILTSESPETVQQWVSVLMPDEVYQVAETERMFLNQEIPAELKAYGVWWD